MFFKKNLLLTLFLAAVIAVSIFSNPLIHAELGDYTPKEPTVLENGSWQVQSIDSPRFFTNLGTPALVFYEAGLPCIVYGDDHLYLACREGGMWLVETVDPQPGVGSHAALAKGADGSLHIAYYDVIHAALKYARYKNGEWSFQVIDQPDEAVELPAGFLGSISITVDAASRPLISYAHPTDASLRFAYFDDNIWWTGVVDAAPGTGIHHSIQADRFGFPHIAYHDPVAQDLLLADWDGGGWVTTRVDEQGDVGRYPSLALDAQEQAHIAYYDEGAQSLKYARRLEGSQSFEIQTLADGGRGKYASLALDARGSAMIAYFYEPDWDLEFIRQTGSGWVQEAVDTNDRTGILLTLALDGSTPCISYYASSETLLRFACRTEGGWESQPVDMTTNTGLLTSLAVDASGKPVIAYQNDSQDALKIARRDEGGWNFETVEAAIDTGIHPSLKLDSRGEPRISFWQNLTLKYAQRVDGEWRVEVVDDNRDVGYHSSLALDSADYPHISYYDYTRQDLKYAFWDGQRWTLTTLDSQGDVGEFSSLALDAYERPVISYYDASLGALKLLRMVNGELRREVVDLTGDTELYSSLALDEGGNPHIAYTAHDHALKYARWDGAAWQVETVAESGYGVGITLRLDAAGQPWISAYDMKAQNLALWVRSADEWQVHTVDAPGDVGRFSSLAFTPAGTPLISYYDGTNGDLKFAEWLP